MQFTIEKNTQSKLSTVDFNHLVFGKIFSDHMLVADCLAGEWQQPEIKPYGRFEIAPSLSALHHAQSIFEGLKAYKTDGGDITFFRLADNARRMNVSAERMAMPAIPEELFVEGIRNLVSIDKAFVPAGDEVSLYVRPVYFATDEAIGVKASINYRLIIFTTPTGPFYSEPLKVMIETEYSRSAEGGTGFAKAAGNYGGSFYPTRRAIQKGYHQLIWTDARENKYVEESGSMNLMFVFNGVLTTPPLSHSKLAGITRDSLLTLAKDLGIPVELRDISVQEIVDRYNDGSLNECFGSGTAVGVSHIAVIGHNDREMVLPPFDKRPIATRLGNALIGIKRGTNPDTHGWVSKL
jgi:branched-chain amino acid aminotransferase